MGLCEKALLSNLLHRTLLLATIFCSSVGSSCHPPGTFLSNVVAEKNRHFHPFYSKFNFVWGGRGKVASFSNITGNVPTLLTSIVVIPVLLIIPVIPSIPVAPVYPFILLFSIVLPFINYVAKCNLGEVKHETVLASCLHH